MGGVVIIAATLLAYFLAELITQNTPSASALLLLFLFVGMGVVGFLDDFIKHSKQRSLGLRSKAKMVGQTVIALVFGWLAVSGIFEDSNGVSPASRHLSFIRDTKFVLPAALAIVLFWAMVTGTSNAVNLTDGLDGLASGACVMVFGSFMFVNIWQNNQNCAIHHVPACYQVRDPLDLALVAAAITGACFGFLWWNAPPAQIFMGDTGSLSLGGAMAGFAIMTRTELLLVIIGGLFVVITLSVILQVGFFKASRRYGIVRRVFRVGAGHRVFRMAPLQHHFELLGWEQVTVVIRFWIITGLCVAGGLGVFYAGWVAKA
jgi:phospho-N-acetylmuramoyl-pentapeptide-transferase